MMRVGNLLNTLVFLATLCVVITNASDGLIERKFSDYLEPLLKYAGYMDRDFIDTAKFLTRHIEGDTSEEIKMSIRNMEEFIKFDEESNFDGDRKIREISKRILNQLKFSDNSNNNPLECSTIDIELILRLISSVNSPKRMINYNFDSNPSESALLAVQSVKNPNLYKFLLKELLVRTNNCIRYMGENFNKFLEVAKKQIEAADNLMLNFMVDNIVDYSHTKSSNPDEIYFKLIRSEDSLITKTREQILEPTSTKEMLNSICEPISSLSLPSVGVYILGKAFGLPVDFMNLTAGLNKKRTADGSLKSGSIRENNWTFYKVKEYVRICNIFNTTMKY